MRVIVATKQSNGVPFFKLLNDMHHMNITSLSDYHSSFSILATLILLEYETLKLFSCLNAINYGVNLMIFFLGLSTLVLKGCTTPNSLLFVTVIHNYFINI